MKESKFIEFKSEVTNTFLKTVSAFSNFGAGVIRFGINDDGTVCGIEDPKGACLDIENSINDNISPRPDYSLNIDARSRVITLSVSEGKYKPYLYKGKAYKRYNTSTVPVDQIELKRLTLEGCNMYFEELPGGIDQPSFQYLEKKLIEKLYVSELTNDMLRTFGFLGDDGKVNVAGALFADVNNFSGIDIARFGTTVNEISDRETLSGTSILKQYDEAVAVFKRYYEYEKIEGFERVSVENIPGEAFREAIANALVHRTWDVDSHIRISMHPDRIEVSSPGGLPGGISEQEYLSGNISSLRNPVIGNMFFRMRYIEMFGTGIRRIKESYRNGTQKPRFDVRDNSITVILPVLTCGYTVTTDGQKVLDLLESGMILSGREISEALGWGKDKSIRVVNELKKRGYVRVIGTGRGTKYSVS